MSKKQSKTPKKPGKKRAGGALVEARPRGAGVVPAYLLHVGSIAINAAPGHELVATVVCALFVIVVLWGRLG